MGATNLRIFNPNAAGAAVVVVSQKADWFTLTAFLLHLIGCIHNIPATAAVLVVGVWVYLSGGWWWWIAIRIWRTYIWAANLRRKNPSAAGAAVVVVSQKADDLTITAFLFYIWRCVRDIPATAAVLVVSVRGGNKESRGVWSASNNNYFRTAGCRGCRIVWIGCVSATQAIVIRSICRRNPIAAKRRCAIFLAHDFAITAVFHIGQHIYARAIAAFCSCSTNVTATSTICVGSKFGTHFIAAILTF